MSKSILLIIGGGIAAYKTLDLIRRAKERGIACRVIITKAGTEFVTPLTAAALSGHKVHTDMFDLGSETEMGHIQLTRVVDLVARSGVAARGRAKPRARAREVNPMGQFTDWSAAIHLSMESHAPVPESFQEARL